MWLAISEHVARAIYGSTAIIAAQAWTMTAPTCEDVPKPMRIVRGEKLAGVPLEHVRTLLRRCAYSIIDVDTIAHVLTLDEAHAKRLTRALVRAGYPRKCESSQEHQPIEYERTVEGSALASAKMTRPLRRATVDRLLKEVIERARSINANDAYAYRVAQIALFGSALTDKERPSDVDRGTPIANDSSWWSARACGSPSRAADALATSPICSGLKPKSCSHYAGALVGSVFRTPRRPLGFAPSRRSCFGTLEHTTDRTLSNSVLGVVFVVFTNHCPCSRGRDAHRNALPIDDIHV